MRNHTTKIILISSAAILSLSVLIYIYLLSTFSSLRSDIKDLYTTHSESKSMIGELNKVEQNLKATLINKDRLLALFVKQESIVDFIQMLELLMKKTGVNGSVEDVSEAELSGEDSSGKENLLISLSAGGDWEDLMEFVGLLERIPYKSAIDSFTIELTSSKGASKAELEPRGRWQLSVRMHTLVIKSREQLKPEGKSQSRP